MIDERTKRAILSLARIAIKEELASHKELNEDVLGRLLEMFPTLKEPGAAFVTIKERGSLRGCIGSLVAYRPLYEDVIQNAKAAAFSDPRFPPLSAEEFERITIEISLLTPPRPVEYKDREDLKNKIVPFRDGVVLEYNGKKATFLPQVWEELPDFDAFFAHLCMKAGLMPECLRLHPDISVYEVVSFSEEEI